MAAGSYPRKKESKKGIKRIIRSWCYSAGTLSLESRTGKRLKIVDFPDRFSVISRGKAESEAQLCKP